MARTTGRVEAVAIMRTLRNRVSEEFAALSLEEQRQRIRSAGEGDAMVRGVQFVVDSFGRKTAVQIDLKKQRRLWEDFYDRALAKQRASEPRESLETVKKRVSGRRPQRRRG